MQIVVDGSTVVGWKECETWLPGGWISMVSDVEFRLEPPDTKPPVYWGSVRLWRWREVAHTLAGDLTGVGSKQLTLGLGRGAAAGPQGKRRPGGKPAWDGMWARP